MAGRGTDIVLGGNVESEISRLENADEATVARLRSEWTANHERVLNAGGLHIVGTERHESRRIDNQLRGRSGRQGDPGSSRFYLSLEDNLMRIFGDPNRMKALLSSVGMKEGEAIESGMLTRQIERAQRKVEAYNFDLRKNLLEYDDVANDQRKVIYSQRNELMASEDIGDTVRAHREEVIDALVAQFMPPESVEEQWDIASLEAAFERDFGVRYDLRSWLAEDTSRGPIDAAEELTRQSEAHYATKEALIGSADLRRIERQLMLQMVDTHWREHLAAMDYMRQGIFLRSYAQKNPKQEYKREAFELFTAMLGRIKHDTVTLLSRLQVRSEEDVAREERERAERLASMMRFQHASPPPVIGDAPPEDPMALPAPAPGQVAAADPFVRDERKVGRNEPCPCGSGKKYKQCHGALS